LGCIVEGKKYESNVDRRGGSEPDRQMMGTKWCLRGGKVWSDSGPIEGFQEDGWDEDSKHRR